MILKFEGVKIYALNISKFNNGAAVTLPGIGIILGIKQINNINLLRHEYGHILQRRNKGALFFWVIIAPISLWSAFRTSITKKHIHMLSWTEWSANLLAYNYFNRPIEWDFNKYPVKSTK